MGGVASGIGTVLGHSPGLGPLFGGGNPPAPPSQMVNSVDPRLQQTRDDQIKWAQYYGANLPYYEKQQQNINTDNSRQALSQQLAGVTQNSNARGMLYGSYNQGEQAQAAAQNQAALQAENAIVNQNAQDKLSQLQAQAMGTGIAVNQSQQDINNQAYQIALARQQQAAQAMGSLVSGGGMLGGMAAAGGLL